MLLDQTNFTNVPLAHVIVFSDDVFRCPYANLVADIKFRVSLYLQNFKFVRWNIKYCVFVPFPIEYITKGLANYHIMFYFTVNF